MIRPLLACWFLVFACGSAAAEERPVLPIETVPAPSVIKDACGVSNLQLGSL